jgi:hypothetical protein
MPPFSNHGVAHVLVFGRVSMRPVSIPDRLGRVFNDRCGGRQLRPGTVSQANTFAFVDQYEKRPPLHGDVAFCWTSLTTNLTVDLKEIQELWVTMNCMHGLWGVEVEQESTPTPIHQLCTDLRRQLRQKDVTSVCVMACSSEPQRQQLSRPSKRGPPCAERRVASLGPAPQVAPSRISPIAVHERKQKQ